MATVTVDDSSVSIILSPVDQFLAFHGSFKIPLSHVVDATMADEDIWVRSFSKLVGTNAIVKTAGTFLTMDGLMFCDFRDGKNCLQLTLRDETYKRMAVQLDEGVDPAALAQQIRAKIGTATAPSQP
jgi:hypothetical protein